MKKNIILFLTVTLFTVSCTFEKAKPLPVGCTSTIFYVTDVKPIIDAKCATSGCHEPAGSGTGDFTDFAQLKAAVDNGTFKNDVFILKTMPQGGSLSEDELGKLRCWLDQGAPNN